MKMGTRNDKLINKMFVMTMMVVGVAMFAGSIGSLVDGMVIGKFLGVKQVSATALVAPVIGILSVIATIFGNGLQLILSGLIAKGDKEGVSRVYTTSFMTVLVLMTIIAAALFIFAPQLCMFLGMKGDEADLFPLGVAYCRGYAFGVPFFGLAISITQSLQLDGDRNLSLLAILGAAVVNISGDIICATVLHGGLFEIALVTSLSNLVMFLVVMLHYRPGRTNLMVLSPQLFSFKEIGHLISRGIPNAILIASEFVRAFGMNFTLMAFVGGAGVAAVSEVTNCSSLQASLIAGFYAAISVICGVFAGEDDKKGLASVMKSGFKIGIRLALVLMAFMLLLAGVLPRIFINDEGVIAATKIALRILALSLPFQILSGVICGMFQGLQYTKLASICYILRDMVVPVIFLILFGIRFGSNGVFVGVSVSYVFSLLMLIACINLRMKNTGSDFYSKLMLIDTGKEAFESYEASVGSLEEVSAASEGIRQFCLSLGCSRRTSLVTSLAVEEMCINAIKHNNAGPMKNSIDILLTRKDDKTWILRLRDDYRLFDPCMWLKEHNEDEDEKYEKVGIRMIHELAQNVTYTQLLQMNNLIIDFSEKKP